MKSELTIAGLSEPVSHYVHAVRFEDLLFISGMGPVDARGTLVGEDDITAQTRQTLRNIKLVLDTLGATFADILKVTVFVLDINDREAINVVRQEFFGPWKPPAASSRSRASSSRYEDRDRGDRRPRIVA